MGVTLNKTFVTEAGVHVQNAYVSISNNHISKNKRKGVIKYKTSSNFVITVDIDAHDNGFSAIGYIPVEVETDTPPTGNVYELLYNKLKSMHSCTDSI
jgi:hypothetical protein